MRNDTRPDLLLCVVFIMVPLALCFLIFQYIGYSFQDPLPRSFTNKDFANYWTAGRLILSGQTLDLFGPHDQYFRHMTDAFGPDYPWHNWSYPPHYLLLIWWTGHFSYGASLGFFMAFTFVPFVWAVKAFVGRLDLYVILVVAPFVLVNLWATQNGFITGALALGALSLRSSRPLMAGILLGLLTIKPQLGFLFLFLLIAERRWLMIASAAVTTLVLIGISTLFFGVESWIGYASNVLPYQSAVMQELTGSFLPMLTSLYGGLRIWGFAYSDAILIHGLFAVPIAWLTIRAFFIVRDNEYRAVLLILGTYVITPYALIYDLGVVSAAAALIAIKGGLGEPAKDPYRYLASGVAILPFVAMSFGHYGIPAAPLILISLFGLAYLRSRAPGGILWRVGGRKPAISTSPGAASD